MEKPASSEEVGIARTMLNFFEALRKRDAAALLSTYSPHATIESSFASKVLGIKEFERVVRANIRDLISVNLRDVRVQLKDRSAATVSASSLYCYKKKTIGPSLQMWTLENVEGSWLFTRSEYIS